MVSTKQKDPRQLPVQLNVSIPWAFREFLTGQAERERLSLNKLAASALMDKYGEAYEAEEAKLAPRTVKRSA